MDEPGPPRFGRTRRDPEANSRVRLRSPEVMPSSTILFPSSCGRQGTSGEHPRVSRTINRLDMDHRTQQSPTLHITEGYPWSS